MRCVLYADNRVVDVIEDIGLDDKETLKCNCPNCGAPVKSHTCEYCGTILDPIAMKKRTERVVISRGQIEISSGK
jgi:methionyl-tRNA synthetase